MTAEARKNDVVYGAGEGLGGGLGGPRGAQRDPAGIPAGILSPPVPVGISGRKYGGRSPTGIAQGQGKNSAQTRPQTRAQPVGEATDKATGEATAPEKKKKWGRGRSGCLRRVSVGLGPQWSETKGQGPRAKTQ